MTLGPDLGWLAEDDGTLRPEAARAIAEEVPRPLRRNDGLPHIGVPQLVRVAIPAPWLPVVLIGCMFLGLMLARLFSPSIEVGREAAEGMTPATRTESDQAATVNGVNVNVRSTPSLAAPIIGRLGLGQSVQVGAEQGGWFPVQTASGTEGFVFGALLGGVHSDLGRPATLLYSLQVPTENGVLELSADEKVLAGTATNGFTSVWTAAWVSVRVPDDALAILD